MIIIYLLLKPMQDLVADMKIQPAEDYLVYFLVLVLFLVVQIMLFHRLLLVMPDI